VTHLDRAAGVDDALPTHETFGGVHRDRSDSIFAKVLGDLEHESDFVTLHLESTHDGRQLAVELYVDHSTDDLRNSAIADRSCCGGETPGLKSFRVFRECRDRTLRRAPVHDVTTRLSENLRSPEELP
jgi:hypothetical protein